MLWHHMVVDGQLERSIYESFGDKAYPIMKQAVQAFPEYAWEIAQSTLIGSSNANPKIEKQEPIISAYLPGSPNWYPYDKTIVDHHCMKLHLQSKKVKWKILWLPENMDIKVDVLGNPVWCGQNFDEEFKPSDEWHVYFDNYFDWNERDLVGHCYRKSDLKLKHTKYYFHPAWKQVDDEYMETDWSHLPSEYKKLLPIDVSHQTDLEKTNGDQWVY